MTSLLATGTAQGGQDHGGRGRWVSLISFPNPVNEVSARLVAAGVVIMSVCAIVFDVRWLPYVLAYGFVARVLTGPKLSPLGQLVTRVVTPRLPIAPRLVAGPPKRFAQAIGMVVTVIASVLAGLGLWGAAEIALGLIIVAAFLESALGFCLGCKAFALLMRAGVIPEEVCERCADIWKDRASGRTEPLEGPSLWKDRASGRTEPTPWP